MIFFVFVITAPGAACRLLFLPCVSLVVRNVPDRLRTLVRMQMKALRRLAALRTVAEKNEEVAQANTIDAVDTEAVEEVRCNNKR